jgi:hypothetical protein
VWRRGADGKMECVSLSVIRQEYKKLNRNMFALTFGQLEIPPMAQKMSKKREATALELQAIPLQSRDLVIWP